MSTLASARLAVIGGGIVGLATALTLLRRFPGARVVLLEKERHLATHQTGRNSNVVHAGVYYAPGSLKARLCRKGLQATKHFCDVHGPPYQTPGKLIVATKPQEVTRLNELEARARQNNLGLRRIGQAELGELEPISAGSMPYWLCRQVLPVTARLRPSWRNWSSKQVARFF
jgi:L-2-hydroxyglutarate oxidase